MDNENWKPRPCPFCGGEVFLDTGEHCFVARCMGCAAEGPWHYTPSGAVRGWDKRPADAVKEQLAEALDCCREWLHDEHGDCAGECYQDEDRKPCLQCMVNEALAAYREEQAP